MVKAMIILASMSVVVTGLIAPTPQTSARRVTTTMSAVKTAKKTATKQETLQTRVATAALDATTAVLKVTKKTEGLDTGVSGIKKAIEAIKPSSGDTSLSNSDKWSYVHYPPHPEDPYFDLTRMMKMLDGRPPVNEWFSVGKFVRAIWRLVQAVFVVFAPNDSADSKDPYADIYGLWLKEPAITPIYETDRAFAHQFLAGTNPVLIRRVHSIFEVQDCGATPLIRRFPEVEDMVDDNNLFMVHYDFAAESPRVVESEPEDWPDLCFSPSATVLLTVKEEGLLMPVGIQLGETVYGPSDEEWLYAKTMIVNADSNVHEWVSHLARTHLTTEPQIIAHHNQLSGHKLEPFLKPHFQDTLFLNWAARLTLLKYVAPDEPIDTAQADSAWRESSSVADAEFSVGSCAITKSIQDYWIGYDFFEYGFDAELAKRGFTDLDNDNLPNYFYLQDGLKLWRAIGSYTTAFVDSVYGGNADVRADAQLQAWAAELADPDMGNLKGFPSPILDKATLAKALQTTIWTTSGLHAAVNFPQFDFMSYQPGRPSALLKNMNANCTDFHYIQQHCLPTKDITQGIATTTWLLTLPSDHCLTDLPGKETRTFSSVYQDFKNDLLQISKSIEARNKALEPKRGETQDVPFPYTYLDPKKVPASIDI